MKDIQPLKRLFIKSELKEKSLINLSVSNTHYILNVLRIREKQKLSIFNGFQGEWEGIIKSLNKKKGLILIDKQIKKQEEDNLINIIYVPIKGHRNYYLIEKITELGVSNIYPIISEHSVIKTTNHRGCRRRNMLQDVSICVQTFLCNQIGIIDCSIIRERDSIRTC